MTSQNRTYQGSSPAAYQSRSSVAYSCYKRASNVGDDGVRLIRRHHDDGPLQTVTTLRIGGVFSIAESNARQTAHQCETLPAFPNVGGRRRAAQHFPP